MASAAPVVLGRRSLYMLPTRLGFMFAAALLAMLLAAVNYGNGLAYMFTFQLAAMALVSMLYTHRNLSGLEISAGGCTPVFAGGNAVFTVVVRNRSSRPRLGVRLACAGRELARIDVPAEGSARAALPVPAARRGRLALPPVVITSDFPIGLLFTWSRRLRLDHYCLVYPRPAGERPFAYLADRRRYQESGHRPEGDDFVGLREYRAGDSPRHIHWKALARGGPLVTKQFGGAGQDTVWLDWYALEPLGTEARLSQLSRWLLEAERLHLHYGMRLPDKAFEPAHGEAHRDRCLRALALYNL